MWITTFPSEHELEHGEGAPDLSVNVNKDENSIVFVLAILTAEYYGITEKEAEKIVKAISTTVKEN